MRPNPNRSLRPLAVPRGRAVCLMSASTTAGFVTPWLIMSAAAPDTCGAAIDVPSYGTSAYRSNRGKMTVDGLESGGNIVDCQIIPLIPPSKSFPPGAEISTYGPALE